MLPLVAITAGDPAGIGPEVVAKAVQHPHIRTICQPVVVGDARLFEKTKLQAEISQAIIVKEPVSDLSTLAEYLLAARHAETTPTTIILDLRNLDPGDMEVGKISPLAGSAAVDYVTVAADLALHTPPLVDAVVTAPLNKEAIQQAGVEFIGHTELLMHRAHCAQSTTMLATPGLRVTHVTRHVPLRQVADLITTRAVLDTIECTHKGMKDMGFTQPRIAVAGLNPHNGEHGLLGDEEEEAIAPAVEAARAKGMVVQGPLAPDSVFFQAVRGDFDVVVCMYHDQGHIAIKTKGFEQSITITLGLPFIRTSADHGTAFDIAGKGVADPTSLIEAIKSAVALTTARK